MTEEKSYPCKILKGNRIAIPKEIAKELDMKEGDLIMRKRDGKALVFVKCKVVEL